MQDSLVKIIGVAAGVCLVCSVFVSAAAVALKPRQDANALLFKQQNILLAAGLIEQNDKPSIAQAQAFFDAGKIAAVVVDLNTGEEIENADPNSVDFDKDKKDSAQSTNLREKDISDLARIGVRPNRGVVYMTKKEDGSIDRIVFPIVGKGLWSTMYGFISLNYPDLTVAKINFYAHAETAGLGGEISNPKWQAKWEGKHAFVDPNKPGEGPEIVVVRNGKVSDNPEKAQFEVDGIAGSTLTSVGVSNTVEFWLGKNGFGPYLRRLTADPGSVTK